MPEPRSTAVEGHESGAAALEFDAEGEVRRRYGAAAQVPEQALCCPSPGYDAALLWAIPREVLEVDYGCGDPSKHARSGEVVLDLGSGSGKACFMLAQRVGPTGRVLGVDSNSRMLALSRSHVRGFAAAVGFENVRFLHGRIQDLRLDLDALDAWLERHPVAGVEDLSALEAERARLRARSPLIEDESVDLVVSNCVLNLVRPEDKTQLLHEIRRVLRRGGRAVISDIVCDEAPTAAMLADPQLWSGCLSGAFLEEELLDEFARAGFHGMEILERSEQPWQVIEGIEFRSLTLRAHVGKQGPCLERNQAVVYRGPWSSVTDDDGHRFPRGQRIAVCDKTYRLMTDPDGPYAAAILGLPPCEEIPMDQAPPFACNGVVRRSPKVTKRGGAQAVPVDGTACIGPECC